MSTLAPVLPPGFLESLAERVAPVKAFEWECSRDECDGRPHDRWAYPHARTKQRCPKGDWFIWLLLCGRGFGKTRTGSEVFLDWVIDHPVDTEDRATEWLIAGPTYDDTVKLLFQGVSSLKHSLARRGYKDRKLEPSAQQWYEWNKNEKLITLCTGQRIVMQYAEGNDDLGRGGNWSGVWLDEVGTYKNRIRAAWDESVLFSIRAMLPGGWRPRIMLTTTPKVTAREAFELIQELVKDKKPTTVVTQGTTWENADNIPKHTLDLWKEMFPPGTRSRRQELNAELMDEVEGVLWTAALLQKTRVTAVAGMPMARGVLVSVDPAFTHGPSSDDTGIHLLTKTMHKAIPANPLTGTEAVPAKTHVYVLEDHTCHVSVDEWARRAVQLAAKHNATILIEVDNGGDMNISVLRSAARDLQLHCPPIIPVRASGKGSKAARAAPVVAAYENGYVHHVGVLEGLERQQTTWVPDDEDSPDRIDSVVHGVRHLLGIGVPQGGMGTAA